MTDPILDPFVRTLNRNLLKYSAGTAIFCPHCGQVADCRKWVHLSREGAEHGLCCTCYDKALKSEHAMPANTEVLDGRVLFARPKRAKRGQ